MERNNLRRIGAEEMAVLLTKPDLLLLDVRDRASFEKGRIHHSARHVTGPEVERIIMQAPRHVPVAIYCHRGNASLTYAQMFADFGFREVYNLNGGYQGWTILQAETSPLDARLSARLRNWLSEQGFPPDIHAAAGAQMTPLMRACQLGDSAVVAELLVLGARPQDRNSDGNQALWFACYSGNREIMELLIAAGADIDHQNDNGATCLMYAASSGKDDVVARLLEAGANIGLKTLDDFSALDMAASIVYRFRLSGHRFRHQATLLRRAA